MVDPEEAEAPVTPDWVTVHAKVVPVTLLVNAMLLAFPEQIVCEFGVATAVGVGLTVTVTTIFEPRHPLAVGVIV
jgi:hypothetical protein